AGMCTKVIVMYGGRIMEAGRVEDIYYRSSHPYTKGLLASIPRISKTRKPLISIPGTPPDLLNAPPGCPFAPRCTSVMKVCIQNAPPEQELGPGHRAACWLNHPLAGAAHRRWQANG
ncbi:MAG TPA: oligopeptide/dipeptide ABC transporter ATP-binding protein, partial [Bacillota bacterium]|nr:oligopeptide/dipeptide ABC transporter ATP-binding protein [Bacillota bacterium]